MKIRSLYTGPLDEAKICTSWNEGMGRVMFRFEPVPMNPFLMPRELLEDDGPCSKWIRAICEYVGEASETARDYEVWQVR